MRIDFEKKYLKFKKKYLVLKKITQNSSKVLDTQSMKTDFEKKFFKYKKKYLGLNSKNGSAVSDYKEGAYNFDEIMNKSGVAQCLNDNCKYSGKGVFSSDAGYTYDGEVKNGIPNGRGKLTRDGILYEGEYVDGFFNHGIVKNFTNNDIFLVEDEYLYDLKDYKKIIYGDSGGKCVKGNCQDGIGEMIYYGENYDGEFKYGLSHGKGVLKFSDESTKEVSKIVGEFFYGIPKNIKIEFLKGGTFEGELNIDLTKKYGKQTWPNGIVYEGEFKDDIGHGQGKLTYKDNSFFEGEFKDGNIYKGKKYDKNGELLEAGEFYIKDDLIMLLNGNVYFNGIISKIRDGEPIE